MFKVYLAVGFEELENFLKKSKELIEKFIGQPVSFVGETVYREGIISGVEAYQPDVVIIREGLNGKQNLIDIIYNIKINYSDTRVIFLAGDRQPGDALLATLVQYGVYDLIIGSKLDCTAIIKRIIEPKKISDVAYLLPKISVDEKTNKKLFEAPETVNPIKSDVSIKPIKGFADKLKTHEETEEPREVERTEEKINLQDKIKKSIINKVEETKEEISNNDNDDDIIVIDDTDEDENKSTEEKEEVRTPLKKPTIKPLNININKTNDNEEKKVALDLNIEKQTNQIKNHREPVKESVKEPIKQPPIKIEEHKPINTISENKNLKIEKTGTLKTNQPIIKNNPVEKETSNKGLFGMLFGGKKDNNRVNQQILTFMGGKSGVGNSQIAFNTALNLSQNGYKVIYLDLNDRFSSIDYILQLGYADVGVNTALNAFKTSDYNLINLSISNASKILMQTDEDNFLYETYRKMPNLDFMFFSQQYMERIYSNGELISGNIEEISPEFLKDLNMYLLMTGGYDYIILDIPSNIHNKLTEYALIYSTKIFFTLTQDISVIGNHLNDIKIMNKKGINFIEKFYYLINKYENASMNSKKIYELLSNSLRLEKFNMINIPNISKEVIDSNFKGTPLLWSVKSKEFKNAFSEIDKLILQ